MKLTVAFFIALLLVTAAVAHPETSGRSQWLDPATQDDVHLNLELDVSIKNDDVDLDEALDERDLLQPREGSGSTSTTPGKFQ